MAPADESPSEDALGNDDTASAHEIEQALIASDGADLSKRNAPSAWSPNTQISRQDDVRLNKKKPPPHPFTEKATSTPPPAAAPIMTFQNHLSDFADTVKATGDTALIHKFQNLFESAQNSGFCGIFGDSLDDPSLNHESGFLGMLAAPYRPASPSTDPQPTYPLNDGMFHQDEVDCGEYHYGRYSLPLFWNDLSLEERNLWGHMDRYRDLLELRNDTQTGSGMVSGDIRRFTSIGCRGYWESRDEVERDIWGSYRRYSDIMRLRYRRRYGPQQYEVAFFSDGTLDVVEAEAAPLN